VTDERVLRSTIKSQTDEVMRRCRNSEIAGRTVTLKVRYGDFTTITRSRTERAPFISAASAARLVESLYDALETRTGVRLIGVSISNLERVANRGRQLELFSSEDSDEVDVDERRAEVEIATDEIRRRFGTTSIGFGAGKPKPRG
jgi:DNA polymerase-4